MSQKEIVCKVCGKTFCSNIWNAMICSDKCRREMQIIQNRAKREREKAQRMAEPHLDNREKRTVKVRSTMKQLTRDAIEAHKLGVTYGKYIAYYKGRKLHG